MPGKSIATRRATVMFFCAYLVYENVRVSYLPRMASGPGILEERKVPGHKVVRLLKRTV